LISAEVLLHDGPARLCRAFLPSGPVLTPSLLTFSAIEDGCRAFRLPDGSKLSIPPFSSIGAGGGICEAELVAGSPGCSLVRIGEPVPEGIQDLEGGLLLVERDPSFSLSDFINGLVEIRERSSPNALLAVLDSETWLLPLFCMVGVDLFGDAHAWAAHLTGTMLFESFAIPVERLRGDVCNCPHCGGSLPSGPEGLLAHNRWTMERALAQVRGRIRAGELKQLAEGWATSHPEASAALRILYREHYSFLEEKTSITPGGLD